MQDPIQLPCGRAMVASLAAHGVEVVFGIPGTHNLPLYDYLELYGIQHVTPRHEQGGGFAADGYARATGKPGVCLVTTGPGITNIATAAATAEHDSIPILILAPGMPATVEGRDTGYLHETRSQSQALSGLVRHSYRVSTADEAVAAIYNAFRHFATQRPRPVYIEVPLEVLAQGTTTKPFPVYQPEPPQPPNSEQVSAASKLLVHARRPAMILGGGAVDAPTESLALAEQLDAIVATTCNGKGTIPETHPLSIGATLRFAAAREALMSCDVVLAVGTEIAESELWVPYFSFQGDVIRVDIDRAQLHKNVPARVPILGDARQVLQALLATLQGTRPCVELSGALRAEQIRDRIRKESRVHAAPYEALHQDLAKVLDRDAIIAGDGSQVSYFGTALLFPAEKPRRFLYPGGYSPLGYGIPAAIGAKLAFPDRQVIALVGDGAAMFSIAEVATAAMLHLSLPIIIANNSGFAAIRNAMRARGALPIGVDLEAPDFSLLGRAFHGVGVSVRNSAELVPELQRALARCHPTLIEYPVAD